MGEKDIQSAIIESINIVVDDAINKQNFVEYKQGLVLLVKGYSCIVRIADTDYQCKLVEHLHSWIDEGDIVLIQTNGNGNEMIVYGKVGTTKTNSFVIEDTSNSKYISGIEGIEDDGGNVIKPDLQIE